MTKQLQELTVAFGTIPTAVSGLPCMRRLERLVLCIFAGLAQLELLNILFP